MAWSAGTRPKAPRPPASSKPTVRPSGPRRYHLRAAPELLDSPFLRQGGRAFDSQSELLIYDAFERLLGPESPTTWRYQNPVIAGPFEVARVDFTFYGSGRKMAFRVQTERFHYSAGSTKQAYDLRQRILLEIGGWIVIDLPEDRFVNDPTGTAAIILVKKGLRGEEEVNPVTAGTFTGRPARVTG